MPLAGSVASGREQAPRLLYQQDFNAPVSPRRPDACRETGCWQEIDKPRGQSPVPSRGARAHALSAAVHVDYRPRRNFTGHDWHDIAKWKFNYDIEIEWNGERSQNDINYRETSKSVNPRTHVRMQYRLTDQILLWFDTRIVFDGHNRRVRYAGNVADGNLLRTEVRNQYFRREHIIGFRGQF